MRATILLCGLCLFACDDGGEAPVDATPAEPTDSGPDASLADAAVFEDPRFITDEQGRVLILHGVNFMGSAKTPPFLPTVEFETAEIIPRAWGFNHVRYLIIWEGVEPEPGVYDEAYLDAVEAWVDHFHDLGVLVYLDMHQDLWARRYGGDGAPEWAIRHDEQPFAAQPQWFLNYFQPAVQRCFDNFWAYDQGLHADLQDRYAAMWAHVAERFRDHPGVIGYDLMNEPHPGTDLDARELLGTSHPEGSHPRFDQEEFHPFYERLIAAIRAVDADTWIFIEPRYGAPGNGAPSYLPPLADPRPGAARLTYAPHLYSVKTEGAQRYDPETDSAIGDWARERISELEAQPMPLVIGEWGLGASWVNAEGFSVEVVELADSMLAGWSYWVFDLGDWGFLQGDWADPQESENVDWVIRVYPRRIAGVPTAFSYDRGTRRFRLEFEHRPGITGPTEIYVPAARFFPEGWDLKVSDPEGSWSSEWDAERELLFVSTPPSEGAHVIELEPRSSD